MRITGQVLAAAAAVGLAAAGGSAFTNSNTVPTIAAGQGSSLTAGYTVSAIKYVLDDFAQSNELNSVNFTLTPADGRSTSIPTQVRVRLRTGAYSTCTAGAAATSPVSNWVCAQADGFLVSIITTSDIVAVSQPAT